MSKQEEDIEKLKNEKLDRIIIFKLSTDVLVKLDMSGETDAVKTIKEEIVKLINILKSK